MNKNDFPMGARFAAGILKKSLRTVQAHLRKLNFEKLNNGLTSAFIIENEKEFNKLADSIKNARPGNPNLKKKS